MPPFCQVMPENTGTEPRVKKKFLQAPYPARSIMFFDASVAGFKTKVNALPWESSKKTCPIYQNSVSTNVSRKLSNLTGQMKELYEKIKIS